MRGCGAGLLPYYPLASGLLTGKYKPGAIPQGTRLATPRRHEQKFVAEANWPIIERLGNFCQSRGRTLLELAFRQAAELQRIFIGRFRPPDRSASRDALIVAIR